MPAGFYDSQSPGAALARRTYTIGAATLAHRFPLTSSGLNFMDGTDGPGAAKGIRILGTGVITFATLSPLVDGELTTERVAPGDQLNATIAGIDGSTFASLEPNADGDAFTVIW